MKDRVKAVMASLLDLSPDAIADDAGPEAIDGWDSVLHMNLVMALEEEFGTRFSDEQIPELLSADAIVLALKSAAS